MPLRMETRGPLNAAMNQTHGKPVRMARFLPVFGAGIGVMALGFFLWLALMRKFDLSFLYPLQGLDRIVLVFAASVFLRERMSLKLWAGVLMISAGILLVSMS